MPAPVAMSFAASATPISAPETPVILAVCNAAQRQADPVPRPSARLPKTADLGPTGAWIRQARAAAEATHGWPHHGEAS